MKYVNPVSFLETVHGGPVDTENTAALSLLRKKMLAELELSDDKQFKINQWTFDKHQLLQFFDKLTAGNELRYHAQIAADPVLLHFLETGEITGRFADSPLYNENGFLKFISPYYEPLFTNAVLDSLKHQRLQNTSYLFTNPWLLDGEHTTTSYRRIFRYTQVLEEHLKIIIGKLRNGVFIRWKDLSVWANITLVQQLNILPRGFHEFRSDYGICLINVGLAIYQKDFQNGMAILNLVEKLQTTEYVQEENKRWKQRILEHKKEQRKKMSLSQRVGYFIGPLKPRWITEEGAGVLLILISVFLFLTFLTSLPKRKLQPKAATQSEYFTDAITYEPVKYLLSNLQTDSIYPLNNKDTNQTPITGDDVYGPDFMAALQKPLFPNTTDPAVLKTVNDRLKDRKPGATISAPKSNTAHRQSLHLYNRLIVPAIAMIQTPDTFYSCYIAPADSAYVPLQLTVNQLYVYAGQLWNGSKEARAPMDDARAYRVKGFFLMPYKNSRQFLKESSLIFKLDPNYWATSDRNIPIEIGLTDSTSLYFNLLENNAAGIELEIGN
ncbi:MULTISPECIES: hypothetical protein [unclassified Chitinophaga]|uniref:hypothetical protein n=1 Tax=unclassified Chitinophaga TaxID=2619133 RepID=UPI00300FBA43